MRDTKASCGGSVEHRRREPPPQPGRWGSV